MIIFNVDNVTVQLLESGIMSGQPLFLSLKVKEAEARPAPPTCHLKLRVCRRWYNIKTKTVNDKIQRLQWQRTITNDIDEYSRNRWRQKTRKMVKTKKMTKNQKLLRKICNVLFNSMVLERGWWCQKGPSEDWKYLEELSESRKVGVSPGVGEVVVVSQKTHWQLMKLSSR